MTLYRTLAAALLAAALTTVPVAATAMAEPDDRAASTAAPQTTAEYAIPAEVEHMVILDRAQTDPRTGTPTLVDRDIHCDDGVIMDADPSDFPVQLRVVESTTATALNTESEAVTEFRGGDVLPGRLCESLASYELILRDGEVFGGQLAYMDLAPHWTTEQVQALVGGYGARAWVNGDPLAAAELYDQPGSQSEVLTTPAPGTEVWVGLPYDSVRTPTGIIAGSGSWVPVELPDGTLGWMDSLALDVELPPGDVWAGLETETILIGDLKPSVPAYMPQHVVDTAAPDAITPGQPGRKIADLQPGDELVVSELVWERPAGGWLSLPGIAARSADMPEEHKHLAESLRLAYLPDQNVLVWIPGWAHLTQADLAVQPTTADPTETAPTAEPTQDVVVPAGDPATIALDTTVQRRGTRAGIPSRFTILAGPSDDAPTLGHLAEGGVVYKASAEFVGESSTTHGDLWRAIEVTVDGEPTRAYVHADDVVELGDPVPTAAPAPTAGATEKLVEKAAEKAEGLGDREGGGFGWHPFRDLSNRLAWAAAMIPLLAAFGLLSLGGYRAVVRASGKTPRAGLTIPGKILALAPTGAGVTAGLIAAWLLPSTRLAWTTVVLLGLAAGGVVMARLCSARGALYPTALTPVASGIAAGAGLVVAAMVGLLVGWMPATVAGGIAAGAALAIAGRPDDDEPETEPEPVTEDVDATL